MNSQDKKWKAILVPVLAVILGFLLGAIIMVIFGYNPITGYTVMLNSAFGNPKNIGEVIRQATPLILTALGFSVANSAGFFNIGLSGQALCGWLASVWFALAFPDLPRIIALPVAVLLGALAGAIAAAIPGLLRAFFGTSEVIVTIMLNYVILYGSTGIVQELFPAAYMESKNSTVPIAANTTLRHPFLTNLTNYSRINLGIVIALVALVVIWFLMKKTTLGFEIRSVGLNPFASEYAGMSSKRTIVMSMVISGTLAGLGGVIEGLGTYQNFFTQSASLSIGFDGMAVSLLGSGTSIGILISALLFSILKIGGLGMPGRAGVPFEIVNVVIACIIFFVGINYVIRLFLEKVSKDKNDSSSVVEVEKTESKKESTEGGIL